ncbi:hypothetical protein [Serratia fonticola]
MAIIGTGESKSFTFELGKTIRYVTNRAVNFEMTLTDGSLIKGIIPAGDDFEMTSNGAIKDFKVQIYDAPSGPELVE